MLSIPVLFYHQVSDFQKDGITPFVFEEQMDFIARSGFETISCDTLIAILTGKKKSKNRSVVITFDDAFLDTWVYCFPILKKYGIRATILVVTSRHFDSLPYRPNLDDVWAKKTPPTELPHIKDELKVNKECVLRKEAHPQHLTWQEMDRMQKSGLVSFESHTHLHGRIFVSDQLASFCSPNTHWSLGWATGDDTRLGIPVYPYFSAIGGRRFVSSREIRDFMASYLAQHGADNFFAGKKRRVWIKQLKRVMDEFCLSGKVSLGHFEDLKTMRERIITEMLMSRQIIEEKLARPSHILSYPWGEYSQISVEMAKEAGYKGAVTCNWGSNVPGADPFEIKRFSVDNSDMGWFEKMLCTFSSHRQAKIKAFFKGLRKTKKRY